MNYEVIPNFLSEEEHKTIKEKMMSKVFPWYFNENMTTQKQKDGPFFSHTLYNNYNSCSPDFDICALPILNKINAKGLMEVRANLMTFRGEKYESNWHCDRYFPCKTAIYYVNTTNGYTLLDEEEQISIPCKENTMLIFDSEIRHKAVSQTDSERRIVINFNYFTGDE